MRWANDSCTAIAKRRLTATIFNKEIPGDEASTCVLLFSALPMVGFGGDCTSSAPFGDWGPGIVLDDRMVCVRNQADTGWENQEHHQLSGDLVEYAQGPGDPVDPTRNIGSWTIVDGAGQTGRRVLTIRYDYDGGSSYTFDLYRNRDDIGTNRRIAFCEPGAGTSLITLGVRRGGRTASPVACLP